MVLVSPQRLARGYETGESEAGARAAGIAVQEVATGVGYDSEAAFNRAFERATGFPPAAWRKSALSA